MWWQRDGDFYGIPLGFRRMSVRPMARTSSSLGSQEEDERDQHQGSPNPQHSAKGQLPDVETDEAYEPDLGPPPPPMTSTPAVASATISREMKKPWLGSTRDDHVSLTNANGD